MSPLRVHIAACEIVRLDHLFYARNCKGNLSQRSAIVSSPTYKHCVCKLPRQVDRLEVEEKGIGCLVVGCVDLVLKVEGGRLLRES